MQYIHHTITTSYFFREQLLEKDHETQQYNDKIEAIREEHAKSSDSIRANFKREIVSLFIFFRIKYKAVENVVY